MHGVLVSVSVSAVVYTQILVSDRIGACPYRPFSTVNSKTEIFSYQF